MFSHVVPLVGVPSRPATQTWVNTDLCDGLNPSRVQTPMGGGNLLWRVSPHAYQTHVGIAGATHEVFPEHSVH